jgi:tetratricopeptide (TPR) repeat protein
LVSIVLKRRAEQADGTAADLLRAFTRLPIGTRDERFGFLTFLQSHHLIGPKEPVAYWDGHELREVTITGTEIYREPKESDLPPDLDALLIEAIVLHNEGRPDEAEVRLKRILERVPDHPVARMNLAAVRSAQRQTEASLRLLHEIVDKHPDYLFARCSLAQRLLEQRELEEAEQLLDGLIGRERLHIQEAFLLWGTLAMLYTAKGEEAAAQRLLDGLEAMVEDDDDARRLAGVKDAVARVDPMERIKRPLRTVLQSGPKPTKRSG